VDAANHRATLGRFLLHNREGGDHFGIQRVRLPWTTSVLGRSHTHNLVAFVRRGTYGFGSPGSEVSTLAIVYAPSWPPCANRRRSFGRPPARTRETGSETMLETAKVHVAAR
jgi:hypothetical protein